LGDVALQHFDGGHCRCLPQVIVFINDSR
jgi:hypothetical protein